MRRGTEILLRFDTEDFLTPESDDALSLILDILEELGLPATFPLVAEKLRAMRARGRRDVIAKLRRHAVGYHSDTHSVHPTIAEELEPLGWHEGVAAFEAREGRGVAEVGETFGELACYTPPGANWVPHAFPVLRRWGIPCHYSESWNAYVDCSGRPFFWGGLLHWSPPVAAPKPFLSRLPACLPEAIEMVERAAEEVSLLNIVAHPTELCTSEFWDVTNFAGGASPPRWAWRPAPLRPREDVEAAAAAFRTYLRALVDRGLTFLTIADLVRRYPDRARGAWIPVRPLAEALRESACPLTGHGLCLSASEAFAALVQALAADRIPVFVPWKYLDGPPSPPPTQRAYGPLGEDALRQAARWAARQDQVPAAIPLPGGAAAAPADFLLACASYLRGEPPRLLPTAVAAERFVRPEDELHWDWPIFRPGFRGDNLRALALLQAWTMKPAEPSQGPWRAAV